MVAWAWERRAGFVVQCAACTLPARQAAGGVRGRHSKAPDFCCERAPSLSVSLSQVCFAQCRSASRIGQSDGDINRKRIKALRLELQKKGWKSIGY